MEATRIARAARLAGFDVPFLRPTADRNQSLALVIDEMVRHIERAEPDASLFRVPNNYRKEPPRRESAPAGQAPRRPGR